MLSKVSFKIFFLCMLFCALLVSFASSVLFTQTYTHLKEEKLTSLLKARKVALNDYLQQITYSLKSQAKHPETVLALKSFSEAWNQIEGDKTEILQKAYIKNSPFPAGQKEKLDRSNDPFIEEYSDAHLANHPRFRDLLMSGGYYDIFLFDMDGNLIYSVYKEWDYATNLKNGKWMTTDLGTIFRETALEKNKNTLLFLDFNPYPPSNNLPASFIAASVYEGNTKIGVIAYQMPIDGINKIMARYEGLGESGEIYLVGDDKLMRSNSRFSKKSSILKTRVSGATVNKAIDAEEGVEYVKDYRGVTVMSAYTFLDFLDTRWVMLAEQDKSEITKPLIKIYIILGSTALVGAIFLCIVIGMIATYYDRKYGIKTRIKINQIDY